MLSTSFALLKLADSRGRRRGARRASADNPSGSVGQAPLFFLHIPRTGGTSLIEYLDRKVAGAGICPAHEMFEFEALEARGQLRGFGFYRGHYGINLPDRMAPSGRLITLLRPPVPRIFSTWRHLRSTRPPFAGEASQMARAIESDSEAARNLGFREFCEFIMAQGRRSFFNQMTVLLGLGRGWEVAAAGLPKVDRALLDKAKRALDRFSFIGFTESMDQSITSLQRQFGWEAETIARLNAAPSENFPEGAAFFDWLSSAAEFDAELYEYAKQRALALESVD
jgi:hypothetical protein